MTFLLPDGSEAVSHLSELDFHSLLAHARRGSVVIKVAIMYGKMYMHLDILDLQPKPQNINTDPLSVG